MSHFLMTTDCKDGHTYVCLIQRVLEIPVAGLLVHCIFNQIILKITLFSTRVGEGIIKYPCKIGFEYYF